MRNASLEKIMEFNEKVPSESHLSASEVALFMSYANQTELTSETSLEKVLNWPQGKTLFLLQI